VALVEARRATQLDETVTASDARLSQQDCEALEQILSETAPVTGPSPEGM
jgi:aryl-alcohol dehydrogenase-like predicted oxidoreductase